MTSSFRVERDSMGELQVPADALWGAQTQRAVREFPHQRPDAAARLHPRARRWSSRRRPRANTALGLLDPAPRAGDRRRAAAEVAAGAARRALPDRRVPDRLGHQHQHERQRGDRRTRQRPARQRRCTPTITSTWARAATTAFPTAIHVSAALAVQRAAAAGARAPARGAAGQGARGGRHREDRAHAPDGRHAGDAGAGALRLAHADRERHRARAGRASRACYALAQGGTAVGTGINAHPQFGQRFCAELSAITRHRVRAQRATTSRPCRRRTRPWSSPGS